MQVGVLLLAAGTIVGGAWAHSAWGGFWAWEPKEVWALITLLVYLVPLLGRFAGWMNTFGFVAASVVCFMAVLMSWYGVNFVLRVGLHDYGFTEGGDGEDRDGMCARPARGRRPPRRGGCHDRGSPFMVARADSRSVRRADRGRERPSSSSSPSSPCSPRAGAADRRLEQSSAIVSGRSSRITARLPRQRGEKGTPAFDGSRGIRSGCATESSGGPCSRTCGPAIMPPAGKPRPSAAELAALEDWIKYGAFGIDPKDPDPGRVTVRRLNRVEYRNTIRDLMGVDYDTTAEFPPDDTGHGFDNIGDVLTLSPLLLEKYLARGQVDHLAGRADGPEGRRRDE